MRMSEFAVVAYEPYWSAELAYRREQADRTRPAGPRVRRHWLPRRPGLRLPQQRRRPVAIA